MRYRTFFTLALSVGLLVSCGCRSTTQPATTASQETATSATQTTGGTSSTSASVYHSSESISDWSTATATTSESFSYSSSSETYTGTSTEEPANYVQLDKNDALTTSGTSLSVTKKAVTYTITGGAVSAAPDYFSLAQGGYFTNTTAFTSFVGVKVTFTRTTSYGNLLYKGSAYQITSPNNGAYHLYSDVYLPILGSDGNQTNASYVSLYAAVGTFVITAIQLYTSTAAVTVPTGAKTIDFYSINDTHGAAEYKVASGTYQIGINRLSDHYMKVAHANPEGSVIVSSGDMWQGSADSNLTNGHVMIDWMNLVGFESMAIGNHEFDWGVSMIAANSKVANFPYLGINIQDTAGQRPSWAQPSKVVYRSGLKIGIIGAIGQLESSIATSSLGGYTFASNYATMVHDEAARLRASGCVMVVLSIHNGSFDTSLCHNIDAVFEGHTHQLKYYTDEYNIPHVQTYANGSAVQHLSFTVDGTSVTFASHDYLSTYDLSTLSEEPMTKALYDYYLAQVATVKNEVLYTNGPGYSVDSLGQIGADSLNAYMKSTFKSYTIVTSLINTGGVRQQITAGDVTFGEVYATFPFDNENHLCRALGKNLRTIMNGGFYSSTGSIDSTTLDSNTYYYFTTLSYTSESASYSSLLEIVERDTYFIRNIVADYFRALEKAKA